MSTHCWHNEGGGVSTAMAGANSGTSGARCCYCGLFQSRKWHEEYENIEGHGTRFRRLVRVYAKDDATCPERP